MPKSRARLQAGIVHLLPLVVVVVAIIVVLGLLLLRGGVVRKAPSEAPRAARQQVELTSGYSNPFEKETQYVNPFAEYKNPFDSLN